MLEVLRDPIWQFAGAILAFVAVGISIVIYLLQKQRKNIEYDVLSSTPVLTELEEGIGTIQLVFNGVPVANPRLVVIRLINCGNLPIKSDDYEKPISFIFLDEENCILSAVLTEKSPDNLEISLSYKKNTVTLEPALLNPQDSLDIKLLVSGKKCPIKVDARICGVHKIRLTSDARWMDLLLIVFGLSCFSGGIWLWPDGGLAHSGFSWRFMLSVVFICFGMVAYYQFMQRSLNHPRKRQEFMRIMEFILK